MMKAQIETVDPPASAAQEMRLTIDGMHCAGCVGRVESALMDVDGVDRVVVSLGGASAQVQGANLNADQLIESVRRGGFDADLAVERESVAEQRSLIEQRQYDSALRWRNRVIVGLALWFPLAVIHWLGGSLGLYSSDHPSSFWSWIMAGIAAVIAVYVGGAFYASAFKAAKARSTNMDTLVSIGATAAFGLSMVVLLLREMGVEAALSQPLYFGEAAGLLTLISLGHWLEAKTSAAANSAVRELLALQPDEVTRVTSASDTAGQVVESAEIRPGDLMLIRPGERIAVDGVIADGRTTLDEAVVTGESMPIDRAPGEPVVAGAMNLTGRIVVRADTDGRDTTVSRLAELVRTAQAGKTNIQRLADRVCAVFVPAVLLIAAVTFVGWVIFGGDDRWVSAIVYATTVLVISCPCALGLATPTAVMVGSGAASRRGILIKSAGTLERAAGINVVMLDKTGTLTKGQPIVSYGDDETLRIAAAIAVSSRHPLSEAIVTEAESRKLQPPPAEEITEEAGRGVRGLVNGDKIQLISAHAAGELGIALDDADTSSSGGTTALTQSAVLRNDQLVGMIGFEDELRADARELIDHLKVLGIEPIMLTGDCEAVALDIGARIGMAPEHVRAELNPEQKLRAVRDEAANGGRVVAMVGDGINDAAALAAAGAAGGIGVAMHAGTNIAIESADVVIPGDQLTTICDLVMIARLSLQTIKQNLFLSFIYNSLAIPAAAFGLLGMQGPLIAAAAMGVSDLCVIGNSLRLKRRLARR